MNIEEMKAYLKIDKNSLDEEIVQQPSLLGAVSDAFAMAAAERDHAKEEAAVVDGELDALYRQDHEKATEGAIKAMIQADRLHMIAYEAYLKSKQKADRLQALKEAFQSRGYMLRDLVSLYTANYYQQESVRTTASQDRVVYHRRQARSAEEAAK